MAILRKCVIPANICLSAPCLNNFKYCVPPFLTEYKRFMNNELEINIRKFSRVSHVTSSPISRQNIPHLSRSWSEQKQKFKLKRHQKLYLQFTRFYSPLPIDSTIEDIDVQTRPDLPGKTAESAKYDRSRPHIPVMVDEVLQALRPLDGQFIIDMTFGAGGHASEILSAASSLKYIASDCDPLAYEMAKKLATQQSDNEVLPVHSKFSELPLHLDSLGVPPQSVDAFLFDFGASSMQFDEGDRGFSLSKDGPLDMRMDSKRFPDSPTAADVVNTLDAHDLAHIIKKYGEEAKSKQIAQAIVDARYAFGKFTHTHQLADVVQSVFESLAFRQDKLYRQAHVATKTFQALRIFVNNELNEIHNGLEVARHFLKPGGRCVVISFHSLEDRIVKRHFHGIDVDEASNLTIHDHFRNPTKVFEVDYVKDEFMGHPWTPLSRKVLEPCADEVHKNPRSRSAKLRAAVREEFTPTYRAPEDYFSD